MERRSLTTKLIVSPSFAVAGDFSSQVVDDNFSGPISIIKTPKRESIALQSSYELCPLPDLLSLERPSPDPFVEMLPYPPPPIVSGDLVPMIESSNKRFRSSTIMVKPPSSEIARRRRSKISERIRILESLMPWEKKMTMGTMLEEAHKYIRFLEAQVTALQTMPVQSARLGSVGVDHGGLEMLNRQQMLEVMVNSSMVQSILYKKGFCVFSAEQVAELRRKVGEGWSPVMLLTGSSSASFAGGY